jgi:hypothetical protein
VRSSFHYNSPFITIFKGAIWLCYVGGTYQIFQQGEDEEEEEEDERKSTTSQEKGRAELLFSRSLVGWFVRIYIATLLVTYAFTEVAHPLLLAPKGILPFLPRLITSVVCALQLSLCWVLSLYCILLT